MIQVVTSLDFRGCEVTFFGVMLKVIIFGGSEVIFLGLLATSNQGIKMSLPMSWQSQALLSATDLKLGESGNPPSGKCTVMIKDPESFRNSHLGTHQRKTHHFGAQQLREKIPAAIDEMECTGSVRDNPILYQIIIPHITRISI